MIKAVYASAIWGYFLTPPKDKRINQTMGVEDIIGCRTLSPSPLTPDNSHSGGGGDGNGDGCQGRIATRGRVRHNPGRAAQLLRSARRCLASLP